MTLTEHFPRAGNVDPVQSADDDEEDEMIVVFIDDDGSVTIHRELDDEFLGERDCLLPGSDAAVWVDEWMPVICPHTRRSEP